MKIGLKKCQKKCQAPANKWYEAVKLAHIRCPLKAIISYNQKDQRDKTDESKNKNVIEWMKIACSNIEKENEEYLFILGNTSHGIKEKELDYRGYLYYKGSLKSYK